MRRIAALSVCLLLVLSGCNAAPGGGTNYETATTTDATETTTGADASATGTTGAAVDLPPGLSESGVTDAAALADAHVAVLRNTSYAVLTNLTARAPDGRLRARLNATRRVESDPTRTYGRSDVEGENPRAVGLAGFDLEVWATENGTWYAVERSNGTEYRKVSDRLRPSAAERAHRATLFVLFSALNTTVEGVADGPGGSGYWVKSTGVRNPGTLASQLRADSVENVSLTALVSEDGLVREYHLEYTATLGGNTSHVERTVQFTALGETSVERPAWYSEATANETTANEATANETTANETTENGIAVSETTTDSSGDG